MAEKYQIGKNAACLQILAIIHVLMCLILTRGKCQSSFGKNVISCMTQVPFLRPVSVGTGYLTAGSFHMSHLCS